MKKVVIRIVSLLVFMLPFVALNAAASTADRIVAVVGNEMILQSEVDEQAMMANLQYPESKEDPLLKSSILESLVIKKIVLTKARLDSIQINEAELQKQVDQRMAFLRSRFRSIEEMEATFSKSYVVIEKEIRDDLKDQQMIGTLRRQKLSGISVTYDEVKDYFERNRLRLPDVPEMVELAQVLVYPQVTEEAKAKARKEIEDIQLKIEEGEDFAQLARQYSQDPGSASLGGDLGYSAKGDFVKKFEDVALALEEGEVSDIVETRFGYHLIQLLDKEKEDFHVRHILIVFDRENLDASAAKAKLEKIRKDVLDGKADFAETARQYSDDPVSAKIGGLINNPETGEAMFAVTSLKEPLKSVVRSLKSSGQVSKVIRVAPEKGIPFFALFRLNKREPAHQLDLQKDYSRIERLAIEQKKDTLFSEWISELRKEVYVRISDI